MDCIRHAARAMLDSWDYEMGGVLPDDDSDQGSEEESSGSGYESCASEKDGLEMEDEMAEHRALRERGRSLRRE